MQGAHHTAVIKFAFSTFTKIIVLLHYLGCAFIYIGSERFVDYEEGSIPWTLAIDDFRGKSIMELIIFADYWVTTVVTTVGYGDYTGSTSLEYSFSFAIEFFGFVIFAAIQVAVRQIFKVESNFESFVGELDSDVLAWLLRMEKL